jgi:chorismate mutase
MRNLSTTAPSRRRFIALLGATLLAACATPQTPETQKLDRLLDLIGQRLGYMDDVARNKWNSGAPIEDLPREQEIIESLGKQAAGYGLDPAIVRDFFRAQIEASKIIQRARFAEWKAQNQPPFRNPPDLRDKIRPALDALTPELMRALADALPVLKSSNPAPLVKERSATIIRTDDIAARDEATAPLLRLAGNK